MKFHTPDQQRAISLAVKIGKKLQLDHPEVEGLYRESNSKKDIAMKLNIRTEYNVSQRIAINAVYYALFGYRGPSSEQFLGLIQDHIQQQILAKEHIRSAGLENQKNGKGMYSLSPQRRREVSINAGSLGGTSAYHQKRGIHAQDCSRRLEVSKKGIEALGLFPWLDQEAIKLGLPSEKSMAYTLATHPSFQHQGQKKGLPNHKLIAYHLNLIYHHEKEVRTSRAVENQLAQMPQEFKERIRNRSWEKEN